MRSLRERHRAQRGAGGDTPAVGDVVIIRIEDKNRGKWPLGIIESLIVGNQSRQRSEIACGKIQRSSKKFQERGPFTVSVSLPQYCVVY